MFGSVDPAGRPSFLLSDKKEGKEALSGRRTEPARPWLALGSPPTHCLRSTFVVVVTLLPSVANRAPQAGPSQCGM